MATNFERIHSLLYLQLTANYNPILRYIAIDSCLAHRAFDLFYVLYSKH